MTFFCYVVALINFFFILKFSKCRRRAWNLGREPQIQISEEFTSDRSVLPMSFDRFYPFMYKLRVIAQLAWKRQYTTTICHNKSEKKTPLNLPQFDLRANSSLIFIALTFYLTPYQADGLVVGFLA